MCREFPSVQNKTPRVGGWAGGFSDGSAKGFVGFPPKFGLFVNSQPTGLHSLPSVRSPWVRSVQESGLVGKVPVFGFSDEAFSVKKSFVGGWFCCVAVAAAALGGVSCEQS